MFDLEILIDLAPAPEVTNGLDKINRGSSREGN
jgi:hypothetical protein